MQDTALKKLKSIEQLYKANETLGGKQKEMANNHLDTIEENLHNLENGRWSWLLLQIKLRKFD